MKKSFGKSILKGMVALSAIAAILFVAVGYRLTQVGDAVQDRIDVCEIAKESIKKNLDPFEELSSLGTDSIPMMLLDSYYIETHQTLSTVKFAPVDKRYEMLASGLDMGVDRYHNRKARKFDPERVEGWCPELLNYQKELLKK